MPVSATLLYPATSDATFDMAYYLSHHFPLVEKKWGPHGLTDWKVIELQAGPDGKKPYSISAFITWKDEESRNKALGGTDEISTTVFADVPNFSNKDPLVFPGNIVGSK